MCRTRVNSYIDAHPIGHAYTLAGTNPYIGAYPIPNSHPSAYFCPQADRDAHAGLHRLR